MNEPLRNLITFALSASIPAVPALAQDYTVMTGQGAVLDSMNTEVAERANREAGRRGTAEEDKGERVAATQAARSGEIARMCAQARPKISRMTPAQVTVYRRHC